MNMNRFLKDYTNVIGTDFQDGHFEMMRFRYKGMSSPRTAKLLNFATRCLSPNEYYCEIGTFAGYTLLSANFENSAHVVGIDNFALLIFAEGRHVIPFEMLKKNVEEAQGHITVLANDFRAVNLRDKLDQNQKMGVLFIDGEHTFNDVTDSFSWAQKYLADEAIIVLDDTNVKGVTESMRAWLKDHPDYEELFYCKTFNDEPSMDWLFHNGIAVIKYQRKDSNA